MRLEFRDFDLFFGGQQYVTLCVYAFISYEVNNIISFLTVSCDILACYSCPLDYVKVYDGLDNTSAVIGTYCGQQRNLVLYSSESSLYVLFVTLQRTANTQNRGFKGIFEFSESFVKLGK